MGLMDKFKNLFTDEEIIEEDDTEPIEIKEVKKEEVNKLPTFMREKIEQEKQEAERINVLKQDDSELKIKKEFKLDRELEKDIISSPNLEERNTFKFPMDFSENDFQETRSRQSVHQKRVNEPVRGREDPRTVAKKEKVSSSKTTEVKKVADLYKDKKPEKKVETPKKFQATPIISPIYGVLDKNYTSGDIEQTSISGENFEERRHSKSVDFDSVRKKAYGNLSKEIKENLMCENCEYLKEVKECKKEPRRKIEKHKEENLLYDVLEQPSEEIKRDFRDITLDEAAENYYDYGVEYEKNCYHDNCYINNSYEEESEEIKILHEEEPESRKNEIPPVKSSINLLSTLKKSMGEEIESQPKKREENLELTNDLFNLIDSMYDERNENK